MIHKIVIPTPFAVGDVNAFLIKGDTLSLVDAGPKTPEAYEALKFGINEAGYSFNDIEQVILTHHHPDHSGWFDAFDQAKILGHAYNNLWLTRDEAFFQFHDAFYLKRLIEEGVPDEYLGWVKKMKRSADLMGEGLLDVILTEGDALPGHPGWSVLETLGHAQSHIVLWNEKTRTMIGGDLVLEKVASNPLIEPPLNPEHGRPRSLLQYNESLKRLLTLPIDVIYTGHGNEVYNAHELIGKRLAKQHDRAMKVLAMLNNGPRTIFELTRELFPAVYEKELGLTLSMTIGQTDYLVEEGLAIETRDEGGILHYEQA
ncbi:MBL fold metallo-hydrolase [Sporosarcina limicola]|uniref:Glyoxylase-like metal-dependent hydrolase (Beta-lactamase superfamily II) n=1 Tax=Sporosarcina limicola TaxID=34101 RepID=A0A927MG67_9BACL|nr:MBL fold metallo-hydrolase [Sporosarcina limicola]MBE1553855.1 glyoxylase-like metal-dependent hydrolase (beta-lactamase superfamily II) [Sporosarcina limicola]